MNWILAIVAALPIVAVGVLMVVFSWTAKRAMSIGWLAAGIIAAFGWNMPVRWLAAATLGPGDAVEVVVTGIIDGTEFEGTDTIKLIDKGKGRDKPSPDDDKGKGKK